jgi:hypothetical protein
MRQYEPLCVMNPMPRGFTPLQNILKHGLDRFPLGNTFEFGID